MQDDWKLQICDRHLGRLGCRLISLPKMIFPAPARKPASEIRRILLVELFEMGAAVMLAPSVRYLRKALPEAELYCLTVEAMSPTWKALGQIPPENIITIASDGALDFIRSAAGVAARLRKIEFDLII